MTSLANLPQSACAAARSLSGLLVLAVFLLFGAATGFSSPAFARAYTRSVAYIRSRVRTARRPDNFQQALDAGRRRMQKKDYDGAIAFFRRAVRLGPRSSEARRLLRMAEFEQQDQAGLRDLGQGRLSYAELSLRRALGIAMNPGMRAQANQASLQLSLVAGERSMRNRSYEAAAQSYEKALALFPNDRTALAGLTEARFRAAFQQGLLALATGAFGQARARFRECLVYKPGAANALKEISRVNQIESDTAQFQGAFAGANASIDAGAWNQADVEIRRLVGVMQEVEQMGVNSPIIFRSRPLLPAYVSYANGDFEGAFQLAQSFQDKTDSARAARFCQFLQSRRRFYYLYAWAPALLGGYIAALIGSIYAGLRRVLAAPGPAAS